MVCVMPSVPIGVQIAGPRLCIGIETSSTVAPRLFNRFAASRTLSLTAASAPGCSKPSFSTPIFRPLTPPPSALVYSSVFGALMRGS